MKYSAAVRAISSKAKSARKAFSAVLGRRWMTGLIAGALLLCGWAQWKGVSREIVGEFYPYGSEFLLHGLTSPLEERVVLSRNMPLSSVSQSLLYHHMSPSARSLWVELLAGASLLLTFALGRLLHSNFCGLLAMLAAVVFRLVMPTGAEETIYLPLVLVAACFAVWRLRSPGTGSSLLLGAGIGVSLLVRSPLFLFPFVLTALEWFSSRGRWFLNRGRPKTKRSR